MKVFWDTNILIDLISDLRSNHLATLELLSFHIISHHQIFINPITLTNAEYILKKLYNIKDFENRIVRVRPYIDICAVNQNQADAAFQNKWKDFEDSLQYQSALEAQFDCIITNDKKGFKQSTIEVFTPFKFIEEHKI